VNLEVSMIEEEEEKERERESEDYLHDSGGLFLTSLMDGLTAEPSAVIRGSPTRVMLPPPRNSFEEFSRQTVPGKLVRPQVVLESSTEKVILGGGGGGGGEREKGSGKQVLYHRKFRFRPPSIKTLGTIGAKINPADPPTHAYPFR
jgi:hypothetical protein